MEKKAATPYQNNPFMIGLDGLRLIFTNAKSVGIYSIAVTAGLFLLGLIVYILSIVIEYATTGHVSTDTRQQIEMNYTLSEVLLGLGSWLIGLLIYMAASLLIFGPLEYAAAMTAKGKQVTLKEGFKATLDNYGQYFWMYLILIVKVMLWTLLLIIPGIIMFNRYLLSGTVFFAEGKRGNAAIKRSAELTKGAWLTTYAGVWIWNIVSQSIAAVVFWPATVSVLYRQFSAKTDANEVKPPAHILSWLTLLIPIALVVLYCIFVGALLIFLFSTSTAP